MHCTCVRHTELPNTSRLFADVLYHPDRTAPFYRHPYRELSSFQDAAREIDLSDERRAALVAALREQNPGEPVARAPGAAGDGRGGDGAAGRAVFRTGVHDVQGPARGEARGAGFPRMGFRPCRSSGWRPRTTTFPKSTTSGCSTRRIRRSSSRCGGRRTRSRWATSVWPRLRSDELRTALQGLPYGEEVADLVAQAYRPGATMGSAFGDLLRRLLDSLRRASGGPDAAGIPAAGGAAAAVGGRGGAGADERGAGAK